MKSLVQSLMPLYDPREARAVVRAVLEDVFNLSYTQQCLTGIDTLTAEQRTELQSIMSRLQNGEPMQYVTGTAPFCGLTFRVTPATLIPRPETEWLATSPLLPQEGKCRVLDIGTGSGCIAIAIAKQHPDWEVYACDINEEALAVARQNAEDNGVNVSFFHADVLNLYTSTLKGVNLITPTLKRADTTTLREANLSPLMGVEERPFSIIVSNPPYICHSEARDMTPWVLNHEPHTALFVSDSDPLIFYHAIACHGINLLRPGGQIMLECNTRFTAEVAQLLTATGYSQATIHRDCYDRTRFVTATL